MKKQYHVSSIDELLKWLGVTYTPGLPDANTSEAHIWRVPETDTTGINILDWDGRYPELYTTTRYTEYRKTHMLAADGIRYFAWEKI